MATIVIFGWIIFSYKLYKQIYLINILAAAVWKFWQVWFNFDCFQHISALKSIKYPRVPLKESQHSPVSFLYSSPCLDLVHIYATTLIWLLTPHCWGHLVLLQPPPTIQTFHQCLDEMQWFEAIFKMFGGAMFEAIEVKGCSMLNFEVMTSKFIHSFLKVWLPTLKK